MRSLACVAGEKYRQYPISEPLFKGAAVFKKPGTVRVVFTRTFLLTLSLWLENSRLSAPGFDSCSSSSPCPPQLVWGKGILLTCGVSERTFPVALHQVSFALLLFGI